MSPDACPLTTLAAVITFGIVSTAAGLYWKRATRRWWLPKHQNYRIEDVCAGVEAYKDIAEGSRPSPPAPRLVQDVLATPVVRSRRPLTFVRDFDNGECDVPGHPPSDYGKHRSMFNYDNTKHKPECVCFLCEEDRHWR